ncbi:cytidylate kinase-like family protein [bacterium]|nr:cytidylate kinase-like family protein [bacterium]
MKNPLPSRAEQNLEAQIRVASRLKELSTSREHAPKPFITISRQFGCEAVALAEYLAPQLDSCEKLDTGSWQVYSRRLIEAMADQQYSYDQLMSALDSRARTAIEDFFDTIFGQISDLRLLHKLVSTMRATASLGHCIIVGRGGAIVTHDLPGGLHIRLVAPEEYRLRGLMERRGWSVEEALRHMREQDMARRSFYQKYLHRDSNEQEIYDLILNTARLTQVEMAEQVVSLFRSRLTKFTNR